MGNNSKSPSTKKISSYEDAKNILVKEGISYKKISYLANGATAVVYKVLSFDKTYVLKVDILGYAPIKREYLNMKFLSIRNISVPKVYAYGKLGNIQYILMEYISGRTITQRNKSKLLVPVAKFYQKMHKIKSTKAEFLDHKEDKYSLLYILPKFKTQYKEFRKMRLVSEKTFAEIDQISKFATHYLSENDHLLKCKEYVFSHADPNPLNYIYNKKIYAIDLTWAKFATPELDVGGFIVKARLNSREKMRFLKAYGIVDERRIKLHEVFRYLSMMGWFMARMTSIAKKTLDRKLYKNYNTELKKMLYYKKRLEVFYGSIHK